jgi:hypothetical protein
LTISRVDSGDKDLVACALVVDVSLVFEPRRIGLDVLVAAPSEARVELRCVGSLVKPRFGLPLVAVLVVAALENRCCWASSRAP